MKPPAPFAIPPPSAWKAGPYVSLACADKDCSVCILGDCEHGCHGPDALRRIDERRERMRRERGAKGIQMMEPPAVYVPPVGNVDGPRWGVLAAVLVTAACVVIWTVFR